MFTKNGQHSNKYYNDFFGRPLKEGLISLKQPSMAAVIETDQCKGLQMLFYRRKTGHVCSLLYGRVHRLRLEKIQFSGFQMTYDSSFFHMAPAELHRGTIIFYLQRTLVILCRQHDDVFGGRGKACLGAAQFFFPPPSYICCLFESFLEEVLNTKYKYTNYPCAVYLKADKLMGRTLQLV